MLVENNKNFEVNHEHGEKIRVLETEYSPSWILLSHCRTLREKGKYVLWKENSIQTWLLSLTSIVLHLDSSTTPSSCHVIWDDLLIQSQTLPPAGVQDPVVNGSMSLSCFSRTQVSPWSSWPSEPEVRPLCYTYWAYYETLLVCSLPICQHMYLGIHFYGPVVSLPKLGLPLPCLILRFYPTDYPTKH